MLIVILERFFTEECQDIFRIDFIKDHINLVRMTGHENLFKVIPGLLSDVNNVHQTSISLLIVAPAPEKIWERLRREYIE